MTSPPADALPPGAESVLERNWTGASTVPSRRR
jgi:hypothetical protein